MESRLHKVNSKINKNDDIQKFSGLVKAEESWLAIGKKVSENQKNLSELQQKQLQSLLQEKREKNPKLSKKQETSKTLVLVLQETIAALEKEKEELEAKLEELEENFKMTVSDKIQKKIDKTMTEIKKVDKHIATLQDKKEKEEERGKLLEAKHQMDIKQCKKVLKQARETAKAKMGNMESSLRTDLLQKEARKDLSLVKQITTGIVHQGKKTKGLVTHPMQVKKELVRMDQLKQDRVDALEAYEEALSVYKSTVQQVNISLSKIDKSLSVSVNLEYSSQISPKVKDWRQSFIQKANAKKELDEESKKRTPVETSKETMEPSDPTTLTDCNATMFGRSRTESISEFLTKEQFFSTKENDEEEVDLIEEVVDEVELDPTADEVLDGGADKEGDEIKKRSTFTH